jgi:mRNA interferase YafQ
MPLEIVRSAQFKRDYKRLGRQGAALGGLRMVIAQLANREILDQRHRDHPLRGQWRGYRECYVQPDLLLIYRVHENELQLARAGSHAELFGQ